MNRILILAFTAAVFMVPARVASGQSTDDIQCADCHSVESLAKRAGVTPARIEESIHAGLDCTDCHQDLTLHNLERDPLRPHGTRVTPVDCGMCHEDVDEQYVMHGRLQVGADPDLPKCWSCHGSHDMLPSSDRRSRVHAVNLPKTCQHCHTDLDLVKRHLTLNDKPILLFDSSVHGRGTKKGLTAVATCSDCHSAANEEGERTAHRILSPADPRSTLYRLNIPDTCGKCHEYITQDYWAGIHGQFVKRGSMDAPVCTTCHGEHGIISPSDPRSPVSSARLAEQTCAPCHESAVLNEKYGLPGGRLASYIDSYHGLKSKAGDTTVANCASCHEAHRILPSSDPTSSIHPDNLKHTCGECHPRITEELARTQIHETSTGLRTGWPQFFRNLYIVLIVATIGAMLIHNAADWYRAVRRLKAKPFIRRLTPGETAQHWVLMISFIVLVITGFSLRFSEAVWVRYLFGWERGFELRGILHRIAAVIMILSSIWHLFYLFTARGRMWFKDMLARKSDFAHVKENMLYYSGLREEGPRFKRFSYMEKLEYWALVWGTIIMSVTGLVLWFDNFLVDTWRLPKVFLDIALVVHYYEAWLATLAILVWHMYGTVFKPGVYPMNPAWISGRMPQDMHEEEHPGDAQPHAETEAPHTQE